MVTARRTSLALAGSLAVVLASACNTNPEVSSGNNKGGSGGGFGTGGVNGGGKGGSSNGSGGSGGGFTLPDGGKPNPGSGGNTGAGGSTCGLMDFNLQKRPAELLLVLDRSKSMQDKATATSTTSKWEDTIPALDETIKATDATVQWGLKMFPTGDQQCALTAGVDVPIAVNNYPAMSAAIMGSSAGGGGTPTAAAINGAVTYLKANASQNVRYLVLATDGEPNCANGGGTRNSDQAGAVAAVKAAQEAGYGTFVVGIATGAEGDATLNLLADAGGHPRNATPKYFPVSSKADLITALGVITGEIADCVFPLDKTPPVPDSVAVDVNSVRTQRGTDWEYGAGNKSIHLIGAKCDLVKQGNVPVKITFGCAGVIIP